MKLTYAVLAACLFSILFTGCGQFNNNPTPSPVYSIPLHSIQNTPAPTTLPKATQTPQITKPWAAIGYFQNPMQIDTASSDQDGVILFKPRITGGTSQEIMAKINQSIEGAINELIQLTGHADGEKIVCGYEIKSNQRGLLSILLVARPADEPKTVFVKPISYYCSTGEKLLLKELFNKNMNWPGRLLDEVNKVADDMNIDLISDVPPVTENNEYYISDKLLVLVYQQYEIASYASGIPQIPIPMYMISDVMDQQFYQWLIK